MDFIDVSESDKNSFENLLNKRIKSIKQFHDTHFEKKYDVYLVELNSKTKAVLKKISLNEYTVNNILKENIIDTVIPTIYELIQFDKEYWLLSEYISGESLSILESNHVKNISLSIANISNFFYENIFLLNKLSPVFDEQLENKYNFLSKLDSNTVIYKAYLKYIQRLKDIPLTLAHDDLLPINVLATKNGLKIIDWEHGRVNTYLTDITRFCCFYNSDKNIFDKGLAFFGEDNLINQIKECFYLSLNDNLKQKISKKQFEYDYELEKLNQNLLNLVHLKKINYDSLSNDWEKYFYNNLLCISENIITKSA